MSSASDIVELQKRVKRAEKNLQSKTGEVKAAMRQLEEEFGCKNRQAAVRMLKALKKRLQDHRKELESKTETIQSALESVEARIAELEE